MMKQYYKEWTPMVMFSNQGDEVIHKGDYFVCVHAVDDTSSKWSYIVQLPVSGRCVEPGEHHNAPLCWDSKDETKRIVNEWNDSAFAALRTMDDNENENNDDE